MAVTLRQIAKIASCSRSSVSLALRNHPHVARETRERIQKIARELGWRPHAELNQQMALVRASGSGRFAPNVAILFNLPRSHWTKEPTPCLHMRGAQARAQALGYGVSVLNLAEDRLSPARVRQILKARGVRAVIYIATLSVEMAREYLEIGADFATAVVGRKQNELPFHVAISNLFATSQEAVRVLLERRFRRVAAVLPEALDRSLDRGFSAGIHAKLMELPREQRIESLLIGHDESFVPERDYATVRDWVAAHRPDCVVTTDPVSIRRCFAGWSPGFALPAVCSLDYHRGQPAIGGINERPLEVGAAGVDLAVAQVSRQETGFPPVPYTLQVEGAWQDAS